MATMIKCDLFEQWNSLLQEAFHKWLSPETILFILLNVQQLNLNINNTPPVQPQNGQIYIYNRGITKNFKADGVNWAKKKNQKSRVQETYDTMRIDGHELHRVYCRSADDSNFQRRIYRLNNESSPIVIVHYRQCLVLHTDTISHASLDPSSDSAQQSEPKTHDDKLIHRSTTTTKHSHSSVVNLRSRQDDFVTILDTSNMPVILDFAPSSGLLHGGEKLLICLSYQLTPCVLNKIILRQENHPIKVYFGSIYVPGMLLTSSVIKCFTPSVAISGAQQITVCIFNHILSTASSGIPLLFDFYEIGSSSSSSSTSNRNRMHTEAAVGTTLNNTHMSTTTNESIQQYQLKISHSNHTHDHNHTSDQAVYTSTKPRSRKFQSVNDHSTTIPSDTTHVTGSLNLASSDSNINEHKVRVVNSDLPMSQLLQRNDEDKNSFDIDFFEFVKHSSLIIVQSTNNQSDPEVTYSNKSEDISIESLSPEILETLTQEYLCTMLTDVVMLATQDDELIEELDILDATGYNFVHYCSIFNLNSLLYTLLLRGARADILTSTGSTALHLAAAQGHTDLVKLLLQHGCDVDIHDASGWTALDLSQQNGHTTVSEYLSVHTRSVSNIPINTVDMNPYMACGINTATISDVPSHDTVGMNIYQLKSDIEENSEQASTEDRITSQVIHQVFSSLSITEKCAFAISIARTQRNKLQLDLSSSTTNTRAVNKNYTDSRADLINPDEIMHKPLSHPESKEWVDVNSSGSQYREIDDSDRSLSRIDTMDDEDRTIRSSRADADEDELQMEIQSVMSEQDVGMVMRLMGDLELSEVEREVRLVFYMNFYMYLYGIMMNYVLYINIMLIHHIPYRTLSYSLSVITYSSSPSLLFRFC